MDLEILQFFSSNTLFFCWKYSLFIYLFINFYLFMYLFIFFLQKFYLNVLNLHKWAKKQGPKSVHSYLHIWTTHSCQFTSCLCFCSVLKKLQSQERTHTHTPENTQSPHRYKCQSITLIITEVYYYLPVTNLKIYINVLHRNAWTCIGTVFWKQRWHFIGKLMMNNVKRLQLYPSVKSPLL